MTFFPAIYSLEGGSMNMGIPLDYFINMILKASSQVAYNMAYIAESVRRFFSPACIDEMLQEFVPHIIGSKLDVSFLFFTF